MELHEKLQELRKQKGVTQEEMAEALYVSRTAVSKWESGRGYPNIESLKALARYFSVSVDELLSGEELMTLAEQDQRDRQAHLRDMVYGLLDCGAVLYLLLPLFAERVGGTITEVSLLALKSEPHYILIPYFVIVCGFMIWGVLQLALQNSTAWLWKYVKTRGSLLLSAAATLVFMVTLEPNAGALAFLFLIIKALMLVKHV